LGRSWVFVSFGLSQTNTRGSDIKLENHDTTLNIISFCCVWLWNRGYWQLFDMVEKIHLKFELLFTNEPVFVHY